MKAAVMRTVKTVLLLTEAAAAADLDRLLHVFCEAVAPAPEIGSAGAGGSGVGSGGGGSGSGSEGSPYAGAPASTTRECSRNGGGVRNGEACDDSDSAAEVAAALMPVASTAGLLSNMSRWEQVIILQRLAARWECELNNKHNNENKKLKNKNKRTGPGTSTRTSTSKCIMEEVSDNGGGNEADEWQAEDGVTVRDVVDGVWNATHFLSLSRTFYPHSSHAFSWTYYQLSLLVLSVLFAEK
jgi:hypothetical protein